MGKRHKHLAYVLPITKKGIVKKSNHQEQHNNQKRHVADIHTKTNSVLNCSNNGCRHGGTNKMSPLVAKPRRRKTRAERNRLRNKTHNKLLHKNDTATAPHEKADFIQHLKKAEDVTSYRVINKSATEKNSFAITQGRLTRQLGLFNKVKKSEKILRAPLVMSESVKEKTELEMKRILDLSSTEVAQPVDLSKIDVSQTDLKKNSQHSQLSQEHRSKIRHATPLSSRSAISLNSNNSACNPCDMDTNETRTKSPETSGNSLPASPALSDIASSLLEGLKPRQMFPGKHYLYETKEELCKLIRQNMPTSAVACTPLGRTPVARISSLRGSLYSDTVKRNLLDCMPPPPMEGDIAPLHRSVKGKSATALMDCTSTACEAVQAPGISQDVLANAKHFLDCNDKAMVSRLIQGVNRPARSKRNMYACGDHTEMCKSMEYGDAYMLQTHMHAFNGNCCSQIQVEHNYPSQMEIDLTEGQCISGICPNIVHYVPTASHTVSQSLPMDPCIHNIDNTQKAVVAQYIHPPGYVCQLPGEFYSTRYHPDDIWLQQHPQVDTMSTQHQPQPQSMDILDYIDHSLESQDTSASRQTNVSLSTGLGDTLYQHLNHRKYPPILHQVTSPDSDDGCTMWFAALPPLPPKPPVGTPSPPEKLYPRRLC
ncbi:hypothetical protein LSAT2_011522 [Lamellibrachia satsuma]|nr:hypothetical protein LSAT2_011522 [Lamellibrachia satsuma]